MPPLNEQVVTHLAALSERGLSANSRNGLIIGLVGAVLLAIMICYAKKWCQVNIKTIQRYHCLLLEAVQILK